MESDINFRAVDFIKTGSMVLHAGFWNGTQILIQEWLNSSTSSEFPFTSGEYENSFLAEKNIGYKYMWYYTPSAQSGYDIFAWGKSDGGVSSWVETMKGITANLVKI